VNVFGSIFSKLLNEDIEHLAEFTSYQGFSTQLLGGNMRLHKKPTIPKDPKFKNNINRNSRHRAAIPRDPGFRKHPQLVPTYLKSNNKINKVEAAKTGARQVLSQDEIEDIRKKYNLGNLHPSAPKKLGNTGIILKFDPQIRGYILHK